MKPAIRHSLAGAFTRRPVPLSLLPERLREAIYFRCYFPVPTGLHGLFEAAPLAYARGMRMRLHATDVAHGCIALTGFVELRLTRRVAQLASEGGLLVDVGANAGYFSLVWAAARPDNRVLAVEPSPRNIALLEDNISRNGLAQRTRILPLALGRKSGRAWFDPGPPAQTGWGGLSLDVTGVEVEVARLDDVLGAREEVAVLKIDAEGADLWVLEGCEALLASRRIRRVFYEENRPRMAVLGILPGAGAVFLSRCGYRVAAMGDAGDDLVEWAAWLP
jgi:FkbM family methyltransferase